VAHNRYQWKKIISYERNNYFVAPPN